MMDLQGKKVLVVGMARSGLAAAELLARHGADVTVNDSKTREALGASAEMLDQLPVKQMLGMPAADCLPGQEMLLISPGIPVSAPFVTRAREMGIEVTGELEMASQLAKGELTAVTGTNGKTTTVTLLGEMFANAGRVTHVVGNIGYPFSAAAMDSRDEDMIVCEVSSFQMETADQFHPKAAALLNITEDHLNRHGTMAEYTRMKMRMFQNQTCADTAVFNADDPTLIPLIPQVHSRVMRFSRKEEVEEGAFCRNGEVLLRMDGAERSVCRADEILIPGPHNLENALAAICVASAMGVPAPVLRHTLRTFKGVEHRIETVRELDGIRYINDSKGTNVDSTIRAVQTMDRPTQIILGGSDKHCDFTPLAEEMLRSPMIRGAVLIGVTADQIQETLQRCGFARIQRAGSLEEAVALARQSAGEGWNVLLSPACASFDMFQDYEHRGRVFKEIVNAL